MSSAHRVTPFPIRERTTTNRLAGPKPAIRVAEPYPLLDPGEYVALCTEASFEWARRWSAWKALLTLEPQNYCGRPYTGRLCKFFGLGKNREAPYAGSRSGFRLLLVEVNGEQPLRPDVDDVTIFVGRLYRITIENVITNGKGEPLAPPHWYSIVRTIHPVAPFTPFNPRNSQNLVNPLTDQPSNPVNPPQASSVVRKVAK
jgi:hypothetical protein